MNADLTIGYNGEAWDSFVEALRWPCEHHYIARIWPEDAEPFDVELHGIDPEDGDFLVRRYDRNSGPNSGVVHVPNVRKVLIY